MGRGGSEGLEFISAESRSKSIFGALRRKPKKRVEVIDRAPVKPILSDSELRAMVSSNTRGMWGYMGVSGREKIEAAGVSSGWALEGSMGMTAEYELGQKARWPHRDLGINDCPIKARAVLAHAPLADGSGFVYVGVITGIQIGPHQAGVESYSSQVVSVSKDLDDVLDKTNSEMERLLEFGLDEDPNADPYEELNSLRDDRPIITDKKREQISYSPITRDDIERDLLYHRGQPSSPRPGGGDWTPGGYQTQISVDEARQRADAWRSIKDTDTRFSNPLKGTEAPEAEAAAQVAA